VIGAGDRVRADGLPRASVAEATGLRLVDATSGGPVEGAAVFQRDAVSRSAHLSAAVAVSDASGSATLPATFKPDADSLVVVARGYLPQRTAVPARGTTETVALVRGATLDVRCVDASDGRPLQGVAVEVSRVALRSRWSYASTPTAEAVDLLPVVEGATCSYRAVSDAAGRCLFEGLAPGRYVYRAISSTHCPVGAEGALTVPSETTLRFQEPYVCAWVVSDDAVSGKSVEWPLKLRARGSGVSLFAKGLEARLAREFPQATVVAFVPDPAAGVRRLKVSSLLAKRGVAQFEVSAVPYSKFVGPEEIRLPIVEAAPPPTTVSILFERSDGRVVDYDEFVLECRTSVGTQLFGPEAAKRLPAGRYRVVPPSPEETERFDPVEFAISGEDRLTVRVPLKMPLVRVAFEAAFSDGSPIGQVVVTYRSRSVSQAFSGPPPFHFWAREGDRCLLKATAYGCRPWASEFEAREGGDPVLALFEVEGGG
jgi:hypothetical protein